ncbi:MAG: flagellar biosynthesis protein FliQ [Phycisphaerales bacterium]|nr:flagellar biosynthesis protein FliQ [Phycisphaerales bacterium]
MEAEGIDAVRQALMYTLLLSAPILGAGLIVGLIVSLVQAVTQIQEQTLSFVPKIAVMLIVSVAMMAWLMTKLADFAIEMFTLQ